MKEQKNNQTNKTKRQSIKHTKTSKKNPQTAALLIQLSLVFYISFVKCLIFMYCVKKGIELRENANFINHCFEKSKLDSICCKKSSCTCGYI